MTKTVFVVNPIFNEEDMFKDRGWEILKSLPKNLHNASRQNLLIQFTGGEDVSPEWYGEGTHPTTRSNLERDRKEREIFELAKHYHIPVAGICRGGQFLHVMNGNNLYQNVDGHSSDDGHLVVDNLSRKEYLVSSTHHQMMRLSDPFKYTGKFVLIAYAEQVSTFRETVREKRKTNEIDVECVFYPFSRSLCFQPHPELPGFPDCTEAYFRYINQYLFNGELS